MNQKKLGFGLMRLPMRDPADPSSIDVEELAKMADAFLDSGFTYFDTAYAYGNSEVAMRETLVKRYPRDSYTIATKLPIMMLQSQEQQEQVFDEQLGRCGVDFFDYYMLHDLSRSTYPLAEKMDSFTFLKGGTLANVPSDAELQLKSHSPELSVASWAVRFAASLENVMVVLSGMSNMEQMLDNISYMRDFVAFSPEENDIVRQTVATINASIAIPCTACRYCVSSCPQNIAIPGYFALYNAEQRDVNRGMGALFELFR